MKKVIGLFLTAVMLCACFTAFAVVASADGELVNYALGATYSAESSVGENIYGLSDGPKGPRGHDEACTRLNDGFSGYGECTGLDRKDADGNVLGPTDNTSVCYTGTGAEITLIFDLGEVKKGIQKIAFLNCVSYFEWGEDNAFDDLDETEAISSTYSRSFNYKKVNMWLAGDDKKFTRYKLDDAWTWEIVGKDDIWTPDVEETELKDCKCRDYYAVFKEAKDARYVKVAITPKTYVLSLDEVQILGSGSAVTPKTTAAGGDTTVADTTAADTTAVDTTAADTTAADTTAADTTVADTTAADGTTAADTTAADTTAADTTAADTTAATEAADTTTSTQPKNDKNGNEGDDEGSNLGLIIGIIAAVVVIAGAAVFFLKKKGNKAA